MSFQIINIFGVDSYRVYIATWSVGFLLSLPVYIIIGTVYCYVLIGYWCFVSIGTFAVCYLAQVNYIEKRNPYCIENDCSIAFYADGANMRVVISRLPCCGAISANMAYEMM